MGGKYRRRKKEVVPCLFLRYSQECLLAGAAVFFLAANVICGQLIYGMGICLLLLLLNRCFNRRLRAYIRHIEQQPIKPGACDEPGIVAYRVMYGACTDDYKRRMAMSSDDEPSLPPERKQV